MGDPKRLTSKYSGPRHPWIKTRIEEEKKLTAEYGLKNKKEIYKATSKLKKYADQAKKLIAATGKQSELEKTQLINKLNRLGLVSKTAQLDDVLSLTVRDLLDRRLQTILHKKGYARTTKQARQFITHGHIIINNKPLTIPSYLVTLAEEPSIQFIEKSSLISTEHPERKFEKIKTAEKPEKKPTRKKKRKKKNKKQDKK
ncbi:30S ribosomal protein S4 [Candidatus Woesearchaeota archaeon]|nr:30S ribosomal protein S4 [Candidatus Woesearchaeota archaeon]